LPCFAVAAVYSGEQNGMNQMYYFRALSLEIILHGAGLERFFRGLCPNNIQAAVF
jgi:hypothetical protein